MLAEMLENRGARRVGGRDFLKPPAWQAGPAGRLAGPAGPPGSELEVQVDCEWG